MIYLKTYQQIYEELDIKTYQSAASKLYWKGYYDRSNKLNSYADSLIIKKYYKDSDRINILIGDKPMSLYPNVVLDYHESDVNGYQYQLFFNISGFTSDEYIPHIGVLIIGIEDGEVHIHDFNSGDSHNIPISVKDDSIDKLINYIADVYLNNREQLDIMQRETEYEYITQYLDELSEQYTEILPSSKDIGNAIKNNTFLKSLI